MPAERLRVRRFPLILVLLGLAAVIAASVGLWVSTLPAAPRLTLEPSDFQHLTGWGDDPVAAAIPAFHKSCAVFLRRPDDAPLDSVHRNADFGRVGEWRPACAAAAALPPGDDAAARRFAEAIFAVLLAGNNGASEGLFTGYFEMTLNGARFRGGHYQTPLYRRPADPTRYSRGEIEDGALTGQGLELLWVEDPIDAFFLEIQGSGQIKLPEGGIVRVGYAAANGKPYVPVGRLLVERGIMPREQVTMAAIRDWMSAHPEEAAALRRDNPSYVFFREIAGDGPIGAETVPLTAERSLAVDRAFLPLGIPLWLDAQQRYAADRVRRLVIAQDIGGAIKGPVRGDLYWGSGKKAAQAAGAMNARGRYYLLLPRDVAARFADQGKVH